MTRELILIGGGHAHMVTLANLHHFIDRGYGVTVISPSDHHYYSGMGPGMLSKTYTPDQIRFATRHLVEKQGGRFIKDKAVKVDADSNTVWTESGGSFAYDVLSINAGSYVPFDVDEQQRSKIFTAKPIEGLIEAQRQLLDIAAKQSIAVGVIGGGAAAVELAGNAWRLLSDNCRYDFKVRLFAGGTILKRFPKKVRQAALHSFKRRGIEVHENKRVRQVVDRGIELESGETLPADFCLSATGVRPSILFKDSGLPTGPDGGLAVNQYLQSTGYPNIFGGGDCIYFEPRPLDKVGVYAVRENPVLFNNIKATLDKGELQSFSPGGAYLLIFNMGDGTGILYKNGILLNNRLAFNIKDYIDTRFMRKFQAFEK